MPSTPTILTHVPLNLCVRLEAEHWPQHQETWVLLSRSPWDLGCEGQLLNWFVKSLSCWPHGGCSGHPASHMMVMAAVAIPPAVDITNVLSPPRIVFFRRTEGVLNSQSLFSFRPLCSLWGKCSRRRYRMHCHGSGLPRGLFYLHRL